MRSTNAEKNEGHPNQRRMKTGRSRVSECHAVHPQSSPADCHRPYDRHWAGTCKRRAHHVPTTVSKADFRHGLSRGNNGRTGHATENHSAGTVLQHAGDDHIDLLADQHRPLFAHNHRAIIQITDTLTE